MDVHDRLRANANALHPALSELRHDLHRRPEIGLQLPQTQARLLAELDGLGLEISVGTALTSITAVLRGGRRNPTAATAVLLRADMDALPVTEASGVDFSSEIPGSMHACGHDLHMAMLVGAARMLSEHRAELDGDVIFMFQPGEEGWDGAGLMVAEGVLDSPGYRVRAAYGMHVMSAKYPPRIFGTRPGTLMAASDALSITVRGAGTHGSTPHLGRDPISGAAEMVTALQTLVTRRFDVFDPVVLTVGMFHGGSRRNIIPDEAHLEATIRTFSAATRAQARIEIPKLCREIARAHGLEAEVALDDEYPLTINNPRHADFAADVVRDVFGDASYAEVANPDPGAEDFSRVLAEVPGCYLMLGAAPTADYRSAPSNHSPRATFSDAVLADGALLHAELAIKALPTFQASDSDEC
jgi:amidohydrolase